MSCGSRAGSCRYRERVKPAGGGGGGSQQCQCAGGVFNGKEIITQQNVAFVMKKEARPITAVSNCSL